MKMVTKRINWHSIFPLSDIYVEYKRFRCKGGLERHFDFLTAAWCVCCSVPVAASQIRTVLSSDVDALGRDIDILGRVTTIFLISPF